MLQSGNMKNEQDKNFEGLQGRYVYLLSPVRYATPDQKLVIQEYAEKLKLAGSVSFNPAKDVKQLDPTGYNIVMTELNFLHEAAKNGGRVDILWNAGGIPSEGSRVDYGIAVSLGLEINLVRIFDEKCPTGPQKCLSLINGWGKEIVEDTIENIRNSDQVIVDWDIEMTGEEQEWQRIFLGLALGEMVQNPNLKIKLGNVVGIDPPEKKSYVKVMEEIEARQSAGK